MASCIPPLFLSSIVLLLAACGGGASIIRDAVPPVATHALAEARDARISASVDAVIVPGGRSAWANNAQWDEYLIRVRHLGGESLRVKEVAIFDALGTRVETRTERSDLIDATREVERRYQASTMLVKSSSGAWMIVGGVAAVAGGVAITAASAAGALMSGGAAAAGGAGAAAFLVLGGVAMAGYGVVRLVNNAQVNDEIKRRSTKLPVVLEAQESARLDVFFPVTPIPTRAEIVYAGAQGEHRLQIDTQAALAGAHLPPPPDPRIYYPEPQFPAQASAVGIESGSVKARLTVDGRGRPRNVEVLESSHPGVFDEAAVRTLRRWRYVASEHDERIIEAEVEFKR